MTSAPGSTGPPAALQVPVAPVPAPAALVADTQARDIVVETDDVLAVFSTQGAVLTSWKLKHYLVSPDSQGAQQRLDLVPTDVPGDRPFTLKSDDPATAAVLAHALYRPSVDHLSLGSASGTLNFEYQDQSGLDVRKTFHFRPDGKAYVIGFDATVDIAGKTQPVTIAWGPALGLGYVPDGSREAQPAAGVLMRNDKVERPSAKTLTSAPTYSDTFLYAGVADHYFLSVVFPGMHPVRLAFQPITAPVPNDPSQKATRTFIAYTISVPESASLAFFFGPKDFNVLHSVDPQLVRAIDFGIFAWLVVPLLQALKWVNSYVQNYGWSIVVLTILMNLAIFPLRHRSMVSMKKMQSLQPEVKAIQDRYAKYKMTDPERQKANTEVMALYKTKGVNPASGCIPMLLTFPLLFAFYALLGSSIELRGAPFMFWIHDPAAARPVLYPADRHGGQHVLATAHDADGRRRSHPAEDVHVHAAHLPVLVSLESERAGGVLVYQQPHGDRAAVRDEPDDRGQSDPVMARVATRKDTL